MNKIKTESSKFTHGNKDYYYYDISKYEFSKKLPKSLKILFENMLRFYDDDIVKKEDIDAFEKWLERKSLNHEIAFRPARVLMQDFTGVPAVVDLAAMRQAMSELGKDPSLINPQNPVDLVIDHSLMVDFFGSYDAMSRNVEKEYERNNERYSFLKWGQNSFKDFKVVPPGTGICHQVNLEYLAKTIWDKDIEGKKYLFPDSVVGTDSHTTMINGISVLGWGVGGIEAEAAMLGQPISMLIPNVIGVRLVGKLQEGITATDLVLTVTERLRKYGVVGKFVEFFGNALDFMTLEDRATIANMAPEYGATCGFFPIDDETLRYQEKTGRDLEHIQLVEKYAKLQGLWNDKEEAEYSDVIEINLDEIRPSLAGPKRPQDRVEIQDLKKNFEKDFLQNIDDKEHEIENHDFTLKHGDVAIAAITSCTNTSNPSVLIAAGLVAQKANNLGLKVKPWVKTSLAPGSQVVSEYLQNSGLQAELDNIGFNLVGYGCTTCIGNSGPLQSEISQAVKENNLTLASVLSGNRNFEGRVSPDVVANFLASPPLVVVYALVGNVRTDITKEPIGQDKNGNDVFLADLWPKSSEINELMHQYVKRDMFIEKYGDVFKGDENWEKIETNPSPTYEFKPSTYVALPPYFADLKMEPEEAKDIEKANILALFGDMITTDHISPAGAIKEDSPAGAYLKENNIERRDFNSYGSRRGNHEVMMRGTFANIRIKNLMLDNVEGGFTKYVPNGEVMPIYDAAMLYKEAKKDLVIFAGELYGTGSSRDWAAKGTNLLGVKAVIANSFERIHRSNLIGMAVLPLQFMEGVTWKSLGLKGDETVSIANVASIKPKDKVKATINFADGSSKDIELLLRIDTENELRYYNNGGILQYVLRNLAK